MSDSSVSPGLVNVTADARASWLRQEGRGPAARTILAWLVLLAPALFTLAFYGFAFDPYFAAPNCGPKTKTLPWTPVPWAVTTTEAHHIGNWRGAAHESFGAAGVIGALLWLGAGVAMGYARRRGFMVLGVMAGFVLLYVLALAVLWWSAPLFWGPRHCVI
jgi:hypothetical protein